MKRRAHDDGLAVVRVSTSISRITLAATIDTTERSIQWAALSSGTAQWIRACSIRTSDLRATASLEITVGRSRITRIATCRSRTRSRGGSANTVPALVRFGTTDRASVSIMCCSRARGQAFSIVTFGHIARATSTIIDTTVVVRSAKTILTHEGVRSFTDCTLFCAAASRRDTRTIATTNPASAGATNHRAWTRLDDGTSQRGHCARAIRTFNGLARSAISVLGIVRAIGRGDRAIAVRATVWSLTRARVREDLCRGWL